MTARSSLHGNIVKPQSQWSFSVAGREVFLEIHPAKGEHTLRLAADAVRTWRESPKVTPPGPLLLDLDGTGRLRLAIETYHERWAKILPGVPGYQRVAWNQTWTDQKVCRLQLFAYDRGFSQPRLVWQTDPPEDTIFQPLNVVQDLDGDGIPEVCVAAHYRVMIFDGANGRKESELRYHQSRPYGWFGLADVDEDGQKELVTIGDFQGHIDVLNYDRKKPEKERLSVRWRRDIEQNIEERKKWPQVGPHPVADVTGDGRLEIVLNLFNDSGDGQWHVVILNAATGAELFNLPRQFVQGVADVDGDGKAELFVIGAAGALVPAYGEIQLLRMGGPTSTSALTEADVEVGPPMRRLIGNGRAGLSTLWSQTNSAWVCADLPRLEADWSTTASQGMREVLLDHSTPDKRPAILVAQRQPGVAAPFSTTLMAMRVGQNGGGERIWQLSGLLGDIQGIAIASTKDGPGASIRLRIPKETPLALTGQGAKARLVENRPLGVRVSTPIVARLRPGGPMIAIVEGAGERIFALQSPSHGRRQKRTARLLWNGPGRGMGDGGRWVGPIAADLDGNGGDEVIAASQDSSGRALLIAYRHDGSQLWRRTFDETPGAVPVWNVGALTFWWPGSFRAHEGIDLFVNTRRGLMHSDVGQLLDGRTGATVWQQEKAVFPGQFNWGYAGIPLAVDDLDRDGLDELISLYPVCFWVADGRTGRLTRGTELAGRKKIPAWAAYGEPMVHTFGTQTPTVLLDSPYILAMLDTNGAPVWHGVGRADFPTSSDADDTTAMRHALVDFAGDGTFEVAAAGYRDGVRAIDAIIGRVLWSLPAPAPTCPRGVAVDIDGRKGDEFLYVAGKRLMAISGDRSAGKILWEWEGPASLSMPAIADLDGDGFAEIILQAADGSVHCIGPQR